MAESVARETHRLSHEKVSFLDVGVQGLCPRLQAYFLALSRIQITRRCWTACLRSTKAIRRRPLHPPKPPPSLRASILALTDWDGFPVASSGTRQLIRDFKIQRRVRQREHQKTIGWIGKTTTLNVHHTFLYISFPFLHDYNTKSLNSRFMEDVNKQRRNFISLSELGYGHLKFSFRRVSPTFDKVSG